VTPYVGNAHSALAEHMARGISQANGDSAGEPLIDAEISRSFGGVYGERAA